MYAGVLLPKVVQLAGEDDLGDVVVPEGGLDEHPVGHTSVTCHANSCENKTQKKTNKLKPT